MGRLYEVLEVFGDPRGVLHMWSLIYGLRSVWGPMGDGGHMGRLHEVWEAYGDPRGSYGAVYMRFGEPRGHRGSFL